MNLWFVNSEGIERVIAVVNCWPHVWNAIDHFIVECNKKKPTWAKPFKSYYTRLWTDPEDGHTVIDVGSHTEFFKTDLEMKDVENDSKSSSEDTESEDE